MNEPFKNEIRQRWDQHEQQRSRGRIGFGLLLLAIGVLLLLRTMDVILFPSWFFTWPVLLIAIGLVSGIKHGFRGPFWLILILIGGFGLADKLDPSLQLNRYIWPVIFICIGLVFMLRPRRKSWSARCGGATGSPDLIADGPATEATMDRRDIIDVTAVFGGIKKNVLSKQFRGGEIVSFMGGSEIDLTQADFTGRITIDTTNIFGGTKLIVPPTWDVQSDITTVFGGVDDKRPVQGVQPDPNKVLILDGTCLFGGIEIRSFG